MYHVECLGRNGGWDPDMGPDNNFETAADAELAIEGVLEQGGEWVSYEDDDGNIRLCEYRAVED